jgi:branched-chain amino acid transport system permease protein
VTRGRPSQSIGVCRALALVGAAAVVVGSLSPWTSFAFGYPGKMTLSGFPGGARIFTLLLVPAAAFVLADIPGRRRAALAGGVGLASVAGYNVVGIAGAGGGLGAAAGGVWVTVGGALLVLAGAYALPDDRAVSGDWHLPAVVELLVVAASLAVLLEAVVWGLDIDESSRFVSFLVFVGTIASVIGRVGVIGWLQQLYVRHRTVMLFATAAVAIAFPFTQHGDARWLRTLSQVGVFAAAAIGLNVVVGLAGLLDLGYVAFFGIGAYTSALLANAGVSSVHAHLPFIVVVLAGAMVAALLGLIIGAPTLRLRGDYLAIVTLGFGEIFRITVNNWDVNCGPHFRLSCLTRGPNGISGIHNLQVGNFDLGAPHRLFGFDLPGIANYYFVELILIAFVIVVFTRLNDSRIGRGWIAIREDELAAAAMGVNTVRLKLLAFAIGAFLAGASGTVNAHLATQVSPDSYDFFQSILLLAAVVLGGMGTVPGAILGSSVLIILPEKLRAFSDKRFLLFGAALVLMMRFRPEGIVASRRRQREFHELDQGSDLVGASGAAPGAPAAPA